MGSSSQSSAFCVVLSGHCSQWSVQSLTEASRRWVCPTALAVLQICRWLQVLQQQAVINQTGQQKEAFWSIHTDNSSWQQTIQNSVLHPAELSSGGVCYSPLKSRVSWKVCLHRPIYKVCRHSAIPIYFQLALINYGKNHNHNYIGQYCNHDYLTRLLVGHMTKSLYEWFV